MFGGIPVPIPEDAPEETEVDKVIEYREEVLRQAGYGSVNAKFLALDSSVDLHEAVDLLEKGCDQTVAVRILL